MTQLKMNNFEIQSLASAVYTICAWPSNRAYVGSVDQLNRDFLKYEREGLYGDRKIHNYHDFVCFYNDVKSAYASFPREDLEADTGQVKFFSDQEHKYYSIFIGNGSEDVFESCYLADKLVSTSQADIHVWRQILEYENQLIELLYPNEIPFNPDFSCPSEDFFTQIQENYAKFSSPELADYFFDYHTVNCELYPFFSEKLKLPIFLPMMKEVFEEHLELTRKSIAIEEATKNVIRERLVNNFSHSNRSLPDYLFDASLCNDHGDEILSEVVALFHNAECVILVPSVNIEHARKIVNSKLARQQITIFGRPNIYQRGHIQIPDHAKIVFFFVKVTEFSPNCNQITFGDKNLHDDISSRDLIGILNHAKSIQGIVEFFCDFLSANQPDITQMYMASGYSGLFEIWEQMDHVIVEGAGSMALIAPSYTQANSNIDFFTSLRDLFPLYAGIEFSNPFHWILRNDIRDGERNSDLSLLGKGNDLEVNIYSDGTKYILYCESDTLTENLPKNSGAVLQSYTEIIDSELKRHKSDIWKKMDRTYLKVVVTSDRILQRIQEGKSISGKYSMKMVTNDLDMQTLYVVPDWERISQNSISQHMRVFENDLLEDLLYGCDFSNSEKLSSKLHIDDSAKRVNGLNSIQIDYFIDPNIYFVVPEDAAFRKARNLIAKVVDEKHVQPKRYTDSEALSPLRMFRNELRSELIRLIEQYDKDSLIIQLMNFHAATLFQIQVHRERLHNFLNSDNLDEGILEKFRDRTISLREELKEYQRVLEYLIEASVIHGKSNSHLASGDEVQVIIALAKWIFDFEVVGDQVMFGATGWISVNIQNNGIVDLNQTVSAENIANEIVQARYRFGDYTTRDKTVDTKYYGLFKEAFLTDTKLDFVIVCEVLGFLYENGEVRSIIKEPEVEVIGNVIKADINFLAKKFVVNAQIAIEQFYRVLRFITLDSDRLKDNSGFIPIWEKKQRSNKFVSKPVLFVGSKMLYTPASIYQCYLDWYNGMFDFTLPYQIGMDKSKRVLEEWKREYEKRIVGSVKDLFASDRYKVYINQELFKLDKSMHHPRDIGDYDVIAIDPKNHVVWVIEVKYLRLNQTALENINAQDEYFLSKKSKGNKFLRRVDYMKENLDKIMHDLNYSGHFNLKSFFVANKIVRSQYKKYPFKILGFNEFRNLLKTDSK
ncbi:MAG: hypothetical protein ABF899_05145 [Oenococcus sp.]|uniref:hypothetical protein n=1 Tax=Oenococcus sp. TaxID=1979414 RepID=UPI0039EB061D